MLKKYIIVLPYLLLFTELNFAPFFMIDCTETDGNSHPENVFNKCRNASALQMNNKSQNVKEIYFTEGHCKCNVETGSEEYLVLNNDKNQIDEYRSINGTNSNKLTTSGEDIKSLRTELPPMSINLVKAEVILI